MTHYIKNGNTFRVMDAEAIDLSNKLPAGNYMVQIDQNGIYYLACIASFELPTKLYGDVERNTHRIITTYHDRSASTGILLTGEKGSGKALSVDQLVYTANGECTIGSINVGDKVYGADGKLTNVIGVYPQGIRDMFEVVFNDGSVVIADGEHLWSTKQTTRSQAGFLKQQIRCVDGKRVATTKTKLLTTDQIKQALEVGVKHVIPLCDPIEFPESDITVDRYLLGVLIGDGCLRSNTPMISSADLEIIESITQVLDDGYCLTKVDGSMYDYRVCQVYPVNNGPNHGMAPNEYATKLTQLGLQGKLSHEKFLPTQLKYDSIENRFALLQGLMDTDGTISKRGSITYTTVSQQLANDVVWLARSLGFRSSIQHARKPIYTYKGEKKIGQLAYTIQLTGAHNDQVFRLQRKRDRINKCSSLTKTIVDIKPMLATEAVCILVDNESHLFVTNNFTVTHNTMLAKNLSNTLLLEGIATVVINECMFGDAFNKFIQSIDQPCVILFDEFEKVYKDEEQEQILTLLDGVFPTKKMFIFTSNDSRRINSHMCNRPGRVFYTIRHSGLEDDFIRQYCKDTLKNKTYIDEICKLSALFDAFNFDMLKALIEEMNRYDESPQDSMRILNAIPEDDDSNEFNVSLVIDGAKMKDNHIQDNGIWWGNPLHPSGFAISYRNPLQDQDGEPYWLEVAIDLATLISMEVDPKTGTFEFTNSFGQYVKLVRSKKTHYNYHAF